LRRDEQNNRKGRLMIRRSKVPGKERRKRPRKNTPHYLFVTEAEEGKVLGRLVDITSDGLMLVSAEAIPTKNYFRLQITLPRMVEDRSELVVEAESIWCKPDKNPEFFRIGFRFLNLSGQDGSLIESVMHTFTLVG
jgi:hypothetical protein